MHELVMRNGRPVPVDQLRRSDGYGMTETADTDKTTDTADRTEANGGP